MTNPRNNIVPISNYSNINYRRQSKKRARYNRVKTIVTNIVIFIAVIAAGSLLMLHIDDNIEVYSSTRNYQFMMDLNNGDREAIERYESHYIARDKYLFNGPLTIELMAEKYNIDFEELYEIYEESGYESAQKFFKDYVQNRAECQEFEDTYCG